MGNVTWNPRQEAEATDKGLRIARIMEGGKLKPQERGTLLRESCWLVVKMELRKEC